MAETVLMEIIDITHDVQEEAFLNNISLISEGIEWVYGPHESLIGHVIATATPCVYQIRATAVEDDARSERPKKSSSSEKERGSATESKGSWVISLELWWELTRDGSSDKGQQ
ncbi:hypothetical protein RND71_042409 [Anisodus tanguticus]|uniref:Uncharacterized protein n=1 Tax=Anisodus tanguticus TaxID=243964 RepID=A0AAE1QTN2_9SOLA|nr:hypothetical protein RND71_042409 [Anisodus tanguticus]